MNKLQKVLMSHHNKHGFRGVFFDSKKGKFRAEIGNWKSGMRRRLGTFVTAKDAAQAYDSAAIDRYGDDAALNFPLPGERKTKFANGCTVHGKENIYVDKAGVMHCRICNRMAASEYKARREAEGYRRTINGWIRVKELGEA